MIPGRMNLLFTALLLASATLPPNALSQAPRAMTDISAPIAYGSSMLVLVSDDGVAAVVFRPTTDGGATYDFRYEGNDGKKLEGAGKPLSETRNAKGDLTGELYVKAGPISVGWSKGGDSKGFIYYTPEKVQVHLAIDDDFRDRMLRVPGGGDRMVPKLDLQRFRKPKAPDRAAPKSERP